jgi:hypothetical protein
MNKAMTTALAVACGALVHPCWSADQVAGWHGRAGYAVGAERIHAIGARSGPAGTWQLSAVQLPPGRAGGAAAALPVPVSAPVEESIALAPYYGRAGGPRTIVPDRTAAGRRAPVSTAARATPGQ